ncbi:MAG: hypothetical protein HKO93_08055 [Flavobacteriales bacterium]|nr:hypothetical protein [Flavobacteriales bacterium]
MTIDLDSLSQISKGWANWNTFNPSQGVIRSLVNTSSFELISDPELRILLVSWEDVLADYQEEENLALQILENHLLPELAENMLWKNGLLDNRFDKSYLSTHQFENLFYRRETLLENILGQEDVEGELILIRRIIDRIIELSHPEKP